jgi:PIN domain nuclease of toxin-antitoxin system
VKFLLDTATFLFAATSDRRLSRVVRQFIESPDDPVYLSAISAWEIAVKHGRGKLLLPEPPDRYVPRLRDEMGVDELPLKEETILRVGRLPSIHGDPFDRALVSQAITMGMTILTPDEAIRQYPVPTIW